MNSISPFAPAQQPAINDVAGVNQAVTSVGIKNNTAPSAGAKPDVLLATFPVGTQVAGVFTRSQTAAAPVDWCRSVLPAGSARALVVNSGNANAFTGVAGMKLVDETVTRAAAVTGCSKEEVFVASTGVIGEEIEVSRILGAIDELGPRVVGNNFEAGASAITTTDTFIKLASTTARIGDADINISGYSKGAGMIMPNMATMLAFVYTDAAIPASVLQPMVVEAIEQSFHRITVDSDTSTNDTVLVFATGAAGNAEHDEKSLEQFRQALTDCLRELAILVVKDGEGISKLVSITVEGAGSDDDAKTIAMSIANSPLVKTAIAGEDANWGRVVMAVGKAGPIIDKHKLSVRFGDHLLAKDGNPVGDDTSGVDAYMKNSEIDVFTSVGDGSGTCTVWTSDLTHEYISINADYRT